MASRSKALCIATAVASLATGAFVLWQRPPNRDLLCPRPDSPPAPRSAPVEANLPAEGAAVAAASASAPQREAEPLASPEAAALGTLLVHVHFARDQAVAADVTMVARLLGGGRQTDVWRARTDRTGTARFENLPAGAMVVTSGRADPDKSATVRAGETTTLDFSIPAGRDIDGVVVDPSGAPVPDALVEFASVAPNRHDVGFVSSAPNDRDAEVVAITDEDGGFDLRDVPARCLIGARAAGFAASELQLFESVAGSDAKVQIELRPAGGMVDGVVVDADGNPVAAATIVIGTGPTSNIVPRQNRAPPLPAVVRSDAQGRFHAIGIAAGRQPVFVRASGFAPFRDECAVTADTTASLRVTLAASATVRGVVRDADGIAVPLATVSVGGGREEAPSRAITSAEGFFELTGLPAGEIEVDVVDGVNGRASARVVAVAGDVVSCDIQMLRPLTLRGRVVDEMRLPVEGASLFCDCTTGTMASKTDRDGRFELSIPLGGSAPTLSVHGDGFEPLAAQSVNPAQGEIELVLRRVAPASAKIVGIVVSSDGGPVANAQVCAIGSAARGAISFCPTDDDGRFEIGPIAPGSWYLMVMNREFQNYHGARHEVLANATWDAGTIVLAVGGWASFVIDGDVSEASLQVFDATNRYRSALGATRADENLRTEPLAPGDYHLIACGPSVAAQCIPFTIRAKAETRVAIRLNPGIRQSLDIALPDGVGDDVEVTLRVERNGDVVFIESLWSAAMSETLWLEPGTYTATASAAGHEGRATFTVASEERPAVQVEIK